MPTGYTSDIYDGKNVTFKDFALKCSRAFGACVHQRDDDPNDPPKFREVDVKYYEDKIKSAKAFKKPTKAEYNEYLSKATKRIENQIKKNKKLAVDYTNLLNQAKAWNPPTKEHERFKEFMIEQLQTSLDHDCGTEYYERELESIKTITYTEYCKEVKDSSNRDIKYYTEAMEKEKNSVTNSNKWLTNLIESL